MIDRLKIETVKVLPAEDLGLLNSVECFPVIHCPSLTPKKICDCQMVKDESIWLIVIGSVNFHSQCAFSFPLCIFQAKVHKDLVECWLVEKLHCNTGIALHLNCLCLQNRVMVNYVLMGLKCLDFLGRVRRHSFP